MAFKTDSCCEIENTDKGVLSHCLVYGARDSGTKSTGVSVGIHAARVEVKGDSGKVIGDGVMNIAGMVLVACRAKREHAVWNSMQFSPKCV